MKLTSHFNLEEFENSSTARARGINNSLNPDNPAHAKIIANLTNLCEHVLEPLREHMQEPIIISSVYRCPKLNKAVGGVSNSQHMTGEACDIHLNDMKKLRQWFTYLKDGQFDQLILERATPTSTHYWIHVSCKSDPSKNRHQVKYITKA